MMLKAVTGACPCPCKLDSFSYGIAASSVSMFNKHTDHQLHRNLSLKSSWRKNLQIQQQHRRVMASAAPPESLQNSRQEQQPSFIRNVLAAIAKPYLEKNPTAVSALDIIRAEDAGPICYDHFAFRTFGINGNGIDSIAQIFLDMGYGTRDELRFPAKKLRALWFSPPKWSVDSKGEEMNGPLPRIFISELLVEQLSPEAQAIIHKYVNAGAAFSKHAAISSVLNCLTWPTPTIEDYEVLARESEYAAWTLVNGYALNHLTVSVHRLTSDIRKIQRLNKLMESNGIKLNSDGGTLKASPDGKLLQSSTVADSQLFSFAGDNKKIVPASYIEFAERLVLPDFAGLPISEIKEWHRRDGFEVGNADKIFESTSSTQTGMK